MTDRTDKPSLVSIFNPFKALHAHEERPARSSQSSSSNPCSASEGDGWKCTHEPVGYTAVDIRRIVIATSSESRRVLTGSVREGKALRRSSAVNVEDLPWPRETFKITPTAVLTIFRSSGWIGNGSVRRRFGGSDSE